MQHNTQHSNHASLIDEYEVELDVTYRQERYRVRDNGAVFRLNQFRKRARPLDKQWTFGRQTPSTGYMLLAGVRVHRIVCSAFHGNPPTDQHVVDHIDTNRANNRPENLRWVTRLENVLLNPISARRIELLYGSIEAFFENPQRVQGATDFPDVSWMRTVTKEDAQKARESLQKWAKTGAVPSGGALGEWLYGAHQLAEFEPELEEYEFLTPSVVQVQWKVPSEFPSCPNRVSGDALEKYAESLEFGNVFVRNDFYHGLDEARDVIRGEIYRRAVEGWEVPVFQGGRQVGSIRKYSDRLLEVRARAILPEHRKDGEEKTDLEGLELSEEEVKERAQRLIEHIRSIRSEPNELL